MALVTLAAGPALAVSGYASVERAYKMSGERKNLKIVARVNDSAPASGLGLGATWGDLNGEEYASLAVLMAQEGGDAGTRSLKLDGYGLFAAVDGQGCEFVEFSEGYGRLSCRRGGYDWATERNYRMSVVRGDDTAKGRLWKIFFINLKTDNKIKVVEFRTPFNRIGEESGIYAYSNVKSCDNPNNFIAVVQKPTAADTDVNWGGVFRHNEECTGTSVSAPLADGEATFRIE